MQWSSFHWQSNCKNQFSRLILNVWGCMTFESTFKVLKPDNFAFYLLQIACFDRWITQFCVLLTFSFKYEKNFWPQYLNFCTYIRFNSIPLRFKYWFFYFAFPGPCHFSESYFALLSCLWAVGTTPSWPWELLVSSISTSSTEGKLCLK